MSALRSSLATALCLGLVGSLGACSRKSPAPAPAASDEPYLQAPIGPADRDEQPRLSFAITKVYGREQPSSAPPWHSPGGDWTFFDAKTGDGAPFTAGVRVGATSESVAFGDAVLVVPDVSAGERLVSGFARIFGGVAPPAKSRRAPQPMNLKLAVLGQGVARDAAGGFRGKGSWTATKLFFELEGLEAEVFFNYSVAEMRGELAEKDSEYRDDLVAAVAILRDGPPVERTPESDQGLTRSGPRVEGWRQIVKGTTRAHGFGAKNERFIYDVAAESGSIVRAASLAAAGDDIEIARVEHAVARVACDDALARCAIDEQVLTSPRTWSSDDEHRIYVVDRPKKERTRIAIDGKVGGLAEAPLSPDARFVAAQVWRANTTGRGRHATLVIADRATRSSQTIAIADAVLNVAGWRGEGEKLRAIVRNGIGRHDGNVRYLLADPRTGKATSLDGPPAGMSDVATLSPDGKYTADCRDGKDLAIANVASKETKVFTFHEDDRAFAKPGCVTWLSPRYLRFHGRRHAFIDRDTMKMSYPFAKDEDVGNLEYSPDFRWVVALRTDGISVGRLVDAP